MNYQNTQDIKHDPKLEKVKRETATPLTPEMMLLTEITQVSVDRTPKDIGDLLMAIQAAESFYYPNRSRYYDIISRIELDGYLSGIINKRIAAVLNKKVVYRAKDGKAVDEFDTFLRSKAFRDIVYRINYARAQGVTGMEFKVGKEIEFVDIPRKHIKPEFGVVSANQNDYSGYDYHQLPLVWIVGEPLDLGYLLKCAFAALIKNSNFSDWAQYVEIFGQPMRVYRYDAYDIKTKSQLKTDATESGGATSIMIPKQVDFEIMDGKTSNGDGQLQDRLKNACDNEMAIVVLGNVETTSSANGGSNAKAKEHGKQQFEITKDDISYTSIWLNDPKFIAILKSYNLPVIEGGYFEFEKELDYNLITQQANVLALVSKNVPVDDDTWYHTAGIDKPANYDKLRKKMDEEKPNWHLQIHDNPDDPNNPNPDDPNNPQPDLNQPKPVKKKMQPNNLTAADKLYNLFARFFALGHAD